jgi:hypothetical protein
VITCRSLVRSFAGAAALAAGLAVAQPGAAPGDVRGSWMIGVGAQVDENSNDSVLGTFNVGVGRTTWLSLAAGRSSSPADRADIEADTLILGVDHRFPKVGFTLAAEDWGDSGALETQDLAGSVYFDRESWRIAFGYETRDIDIPFTVTGPLGNTIRRTFHTGADAYSFDARVALGEYWKLYLGVAEYDYERNLNAIPRIDSLNLLSASTLTLANSFVDHERSIGAEREIGRALFSMRFATDRSGIDGSKFDAYDFAVLVPLGPRVDLEVNVGSGRSEFFDDGYYGGLLFLVYGGGP